VKRPLGLAFLIVLAAAAQDAPPAEQPQMETRTVDIDVGAALQANPEAEAWRKLRTESSNSPTDYARGLEDFLRRFPETARRADIERSLAQSAIEAGDHARILRYGQVVLEREPNNLRLAEFVTRALLNTDDKENAEKALRHARLIENNLRMLELQTPESRSAQADMKRGLDEGIGRALVFRSRAMGNLGRYEEAVKLARSSYAVHPSAEAARETGRWLRKLGRDEEALTAYADAFAINMPGVSTRLRAGDRERLSELYLKTHETEEGLGELILEAWDRTAADLEKKRKELLQIDPNREIRDAMDLEITGLDGEKLAMGSLLGKVVVLDFWATWCRPCVVQHPLYKEVEERYAGRPEVVFLNINTDYEQQVVEPFLEAQNWEKNVYFEDGLKRIFSVNSIPSTIIIGKDGTIASRLTGFNAERFVEMLSERIDRALAAE